MLNFFKVLIYSILSFFSVEVADNAPTLDTVAPQVTSIEMEVMSNDSSSNEEIPSIQSLLSQNGVINLEDNYVYTVSDGLSLPSYTVINGNNATIQINDLFFTDKSSKNYYKFFSQVSSSNQRLEINNLTINWNVPYTLSHVNIYYLFRIEKTTDVVFNNVTFNINGCKQNSIQPIVFLASSDSVYINNCSFNNYTNGSNGSCLWFHSNDPAGYPNVIVSNSNFYSEARDEVISVYGPYAKTVSINNCTIHRHSVQCYDKSMVPLDPSFICLVSKTTHHGKITENPSEASLVSYNNCNIISSSENENLNPYFFVCNSSFYGTPVITSFKDCHIEGSFSKAFISGENQKESLSSAIDNNTIFRDTILVNFENCDINVSTPKLINSRSTNTNFSSCNITTDGYLMDTLYVDTFITCGKYSFVNNTINFTNNKTKHALYGISNQQYQSITMLNNTINHVSSSFKILNESKRDYSQFTYRHLDGSTQETIISGNITE